jgi:hypothetical protein
MNINSEVASAWKAVHMQSACAEMAVGLELALLSYLAGHTFPASEMQ